MCGVCYLLESGESSAQKYGKFYVNQTSPVIIGVINRC